ncbi:related to PIF1 protein precursor [Phialocephala subalpina]|uniref:ATP-dependent DNA helicase PIF1 n=1 Tax=Phialocephala subalpina TaxID=576137 RepID=A0A1L7WWW9_9HELO|nr:related to PIF1 protein precursor [Phialocephala subalpina]
MPPGSRSLVALSLTSRGLQAQLRQARRPLDLSILYVHDTRIRYSSIADAMLGRATKSFEASKPKNDLLAKQLFSSSPAENAKVDEQFKKARQSSQSIGGFTGYTNPSNLSNPLRARSPNVKSTFKQGVSVATNASTYSAPSIFSKQDSFQNTPDTIDLTQEDTVPTKRPSANHTPVEFNEDDFDDDDDLDLDMDFELPMSMAPPPNPTSNRTTAPSPSLPQYKRSEHPPSSQNPTSSAMTWSSSPPANKKTPPGALKRRQQGEQPTQEEADIPRPTKRVRRTLPWLKNNADKDGVNAIEEEENDAVAAMASSGTPVKCIRCMKYGHQTADCPTYKKGKGMNTASTPRDKRIPTTDTASAYREAQKKLKEKNKKAKIDDGMRTAADDYHKTKGKVAMAPITLSKEQESVRELVVNKGKSVFFTGSAGTGKSVLMRAIIADLRKKFVREPDRVAVTASTGLAACNIGGVTLHSFGGIGLGKEDVPALVKKIKRNQKAKNRWLRTKILIIDEISMVDGDLFDKLEGIARAMRNNGRPFGGIQLVITGDFFQLPPVPDYESKGRGVKFAFDAGTWATAIHHTIGLTEVFRQKDPVFANMLNEMRLGKISNETIAAFKRMSRKIDYGDALMATELFPTRNEVENANAFKMRSLHGKPYKFEAADTGSIQDETMREKLLSNMMAPKVLELKKGAQVMLIKNMDDGLVNGSLGKVMAFQTEAMFEIYDNDPDVLDSSIATEDLTEQQQGMRANMAKKESSAKESQMYPLVRFSMPDGTSRDLLVQHEEWKVELPNGEIQAQRRQLPLILAWALSIHKAQGQTLERVKIDLRRVFEKGQAYVALSRATSQDGLEVQNFDKSKVMAHPRVGEFYNSLYSVNKALEYPKVAELPPPKKEKSYEKFMEEKVERYNDFDSDEEAMAAYG